MKRIACFAAALVVALGGVRTAAQENARIETFRGIVTSVSESSMTVERGTRTRVFAVDAKTHVAARGATAKTKEALAAGRPGLTVPDAVHVGDQVVVKYQERGGALLASDIQVRARAGAK